MILAVSRLRVTGRLDEPVRAAFLARPYLAGEPAGLLGVDVFADREDPAVLHLVTRWADAEAFQAWRAAGAEAGARAVVPAGLAIDPASTRVVPLDRPEAGDGPLPLEAAAADSASFVARFLAASRAVHHVVAAPDGRIRACNAAFAALLGRPAAEVIGTALSDHLTEADATALGRRLDAAARDPGERFLLNVCDREHNPHTLTCQVDVRPDGFVLLGEPPREREGALQAELLRLNAEWAVIARERTQLVARERAARGEADEARRRWEFLARSGAALASLTDRDAVLARAARSALSYPADWCVVDVLETDLSVRAAAVAHGDPAKEPVLRRLPEYPPDPAGPHPAAEASRTGRSQLLPEVDESWIERVARFPEHARILRQVGVRSCMVVPISVRRGLLGTVTFVAAESDRRYGRADLEVAEEFARRVAAAMENAQLLQAALQATQEAQVAARIRDTVLARAAHELRTPLTAGLVTMRLLPKALAGSIREAPDELCRIATRNLETMLALVNDLLDAARLESGTESLAAEPVDVGQVVRLGADLVAPTARERGVSLRVAVPDGLRLTADVLKLEQVLVNLLANAVRFSPPGGEVRIEAEATGDAVLVRVRDAGPGIAAEHLERIFEPFFQAGRDRERKAQGTGLGLAISRDIVRLHGGRIWAESEGLGRGSTFVVRLPRAAPGERAA